MYGKVSLLLSGIAMGAATAFAVTHSDLLGHANASASDAYRELNRFGDVYEQVRSSYVTEPDDAKLVAAAISGMVSGLDPHSRYVDAAGFQDMQAQTSGAFSGIGLEVTLEGDRLKVVSAIDDTPAAKAGLLSGDMITAIDGKSTQGMPLQQASRKMRGPENSTVTLTVRRGGDAQPVDVKLVRDTIKLSSVRARKIGGDIAYIRIAQFSGNTFDDFLKAMMEAGVDKGGRNLAGFVIDLRNNPGGLLSQAVEVAGALIGRGEIVSTRGRGPDDSLRYSATGGGLVHTKPIIVLVNGGSASAAEIVAGAWQDHRRATILGTRSFGKGSVQTVFPLGDNGALVLTTARYYTPSGRSIQAKGIDPEIVVKQTLPANPNKQDAVGGEAGLKGHLDNQGDTEQGGSSAYVPDDEKEDMQLNAAVELLHGVRKDPSFPAGGAARR
ncbi:S41 family peptidase [Labrys sp. ZIDIC5]|uniref:S41 family peptidase n=1 Tax=Labrys sedimenti TaxID=3106036 RepID=UPI002ACAFD38|nr:S41 family peptidase [Labrys sp. ZIDIC5]MDZ5453807.1 S41 family peptidase [Labrys sp. ZIDIC5]